MFWNAHCSAKGRDGGDIVPMKPLLKHASTHLFFNSLSTKSLGKTSLIPEWDLWDVTFTLCVCVAGGRRYCFLRMQELFCHIKIGTEVGSWHIQNCHNGPLYYLVILHPPGEWGRSNNLLSFKGSLLSTHGSLTILLKAPASGNVSQNDSLCCFWLCSFFVWRLRRLHTLAKPRWKKEKFQIT